MSHQLETITIAGETHASFAFAGIRKDIWHRLGQAFDSTRLMSADEAMRAAHMDRPLRIVSIPAPDGLQWATDDQGQSIAPSFVVLDGSLFMTEAGDFGEIPSKIVGLAGNQAAQGHAQLTVEDRFLLAEEAIHASRGEAVWSTAGYLRDGRQGFACMEAPPIILDPHGIRDITRSYLTVTWSYDASRATELAASNIRVVCANTQRAHDHDKTTVIKVKATNGAHDRMRLAAEHWARAQNESKALALQGQRMLELTNGREILSGLCEKVLGLVVNKVTMSKRQVTLRQNKLDQLLALYWGPTNVGQVGDNGYAAFQTIVEYLDWYSPVHGDNEIDALVANQYDGVHDNLKVRAANFVLSHN